MSRNSTVGCTVSLVGCLLVLIVKLRRADRCMFILGYCRLCAWWKFKLEATIFISFLLSYYYTLLNLLIHLFLVLFGTVSCLCYLSCHKTLITRVRLLNRSGTEYVPVLGLQQVKIPLWEKYLTAH